MYGEFRLSRMSASFFRDRNPMPDGEDLTTKSSPVDLFMAKWTMPKDPFPTAFPLTQSFGQREFEMARAIFLNFPRGKKQRMEEMEGGVIPGWISNPRNRIDGLSKYIQILVFGKKIGVN